MFRLEVSQTDAVSGTWELQRSRRLRLTAYTVKSCTAKAISLATWKSICLIFQTLTLAPPGDPSGLGKKEQKITPGASLFTSRREGEPAGDAGPWEW